MANRRSTRAATSAATRRSTRGQPAATQGVKDSEPSQGPSLAQTGDGETLSEQYDAEMADDNEPPADDTVTSAVEPTAAQALAASRAKKTPARKTKQTPAAPGPSKRAHNDELLPVDQPSFKKPKTGGKIPVEDSDSDSDSDSGSAEDDGVEDEEDDDDEDGGVFIDFEEEDLACFEHEDEDSEAVDSGAESERETSSSDKSVARSDPAVERSTRRGGLRSLPVARSDQDVASAAVHDGELPSLEATKALPAEKVGKVRRRRKNTAFLKPGYFDDIAGFSIGGRPSKKGKKTLDVEAMKRWEQGWKALIHARYVQACDADDKSMKAQYRRVFQRLGEQGVWKLVDRNTSQAVREATADGLDLEKFKSIESPTPEQMSGSWAIYADALETGQRVRGGYVGQSVSQDGFGARWVDYRRAKKSSNLGKGSSKVGKHVTALREEDVTVQLRVMMLLKKGMMFSHVTLLEGLWTDWFQTKSDHVSDDPASRSFEICTQASIDGTRAVAPHGAVNYDQLNDAHPFMQPSRSQFGKARREAQGTCAMCGGDITSTDVKVRSEPYRERNSELDLYEYPNTLVHAHTCWSTIRRAKTKAGATRESVLAYVATSVAKRAKLAAKLSECACGDKECPFLEPAKEAAVGFVFPPNSAFCLKCQAMVTHWKIASGATAASVRENYEAYLVRRAEVKPVDNCTACGEDDCTRKEPAVAGVGAVFPPASVFCSKCCKMLRVFKMVSGATVASIREELEAYVVRRTEVKPANSCTECGEENCTWKEPPVAGVGAVFPPASVFCQKCYAALRKYKAVKGATVASAREEFEAYMVRRRAKEANKASKA